MKEKDKKCYIISEEDFGTLCICAVRYCFGRQTYMPSLVRSIVSGFLGDLSDKDINVMRDDCDYQDEFELFGDSRIDKPGWIEWKHALDAEIERRKMK